MPLLSYSRVVVIRTGDFGLALGIFGIFICFGSVDYATVFAFAPQISSCVCVCFLPIHSGHQVRWTYQPGSHRRKVT